jgi:hypothetical protein
MAMLPPRWVAPTFAAALGWTRSEPRRNVGTKAFRNVIVEIKTTSTGA